MTMAEMEAKRSSSDSARAEESAPDPDFPRSDADIVADIVADFSRRRPTPLPF